MRYLFFTILLPLTITAAAQDAGNRLMDWSEKNPVEKLYLHLDRNDYYAGQTIWFKGYFMSEFLPSFRNTTLYVELTGPSGPVLRNIFPVYAGTAAGQIELPDSLATDSYQVSAYSPLMLNQPGFVFHTTVTIYGVNGSKERHGKISGGNQLVFFPEGGNLVTGVANVVAFRYSDPGGIPLPVEADIKNSKGVLVDHLKSLHDGMGSFAITPEKDETYYASIRGTGMKFALPAAAGNGIALHITDMPARKRFSILSAGNNVLFRPAYMIGQMQNRIVFRQKLPQEKTEITGIINTEDLYSGILHLTVFNKDGMPLAERITFIDNREYILPAALLEDTVNTGKRKENSFTLSFKDTVTGSFSISVTDADREDAGERQHNIYSWFLLNSDLRGYVHNPSYYFSAASDSVKQALDLVMMTNGWTRFRWIDVAQNKLASPGYKDPGYIRVSGRINIEGTKKPLANKDVLIVTSATGAPERRGMPRLVNTGPAGRFETDSMLFYGNTQILFSEIRGNKNKFIRVTLDADSLGRNYPIPANTYPAESGLQADLQDNIIAGDDTEFLKHRGKVLETITVEAKQKTALQQLDEEYSSGFFSGNVYSRMLDVRKEIYMGDIFQYLQERIPGLKVSGGPGNYSLNYRGGNLRYYLDGDPGDDMTQPAPESGNVTLFLNEMPVNAVMLETIPMSQIALVKLFPGSVASAGGGTALVVYTKKGRDTEIPTDAPTDIVFYKGFTIAKEFYKPDYKSVPVDGRADNRLTLDWIPDVFVNGVDPRVPFSFYNNDRTKRFRIIAEGMTSDGRMLMVEKIVNAGK